MSAVLTKQVKENLLFYNLWTQVTEISLSQDVLFQGIPKEPLSTDETMTDAAIKPRKEIVLPFYLKEVLTPKRLKSIFDELEVKIGRPKRIIIGIVNDDSTIVYYFIHDGIYKPKKN